MTQGQLLLVAMTSIGTKNVESGGHTDGDVATPLAGVVSLVDVTVSKHP